MAALIHYNFFDYKNKRFSANGERNMLIPVQGLPLRDRLIPFTITRTKNPLKGNIRINNVSRQHTKPSVVSRQHQNAKSSPILVGVL